MLSTQNKVNPKDKSFEMPEEIKKQPSKAIELSPVRELDLGSQQETNLFNPDSTPPIISKESIDQMKSVPDSESMINIITSNEATIVAEVIQEAATAKVAEDQNLSRLLEAVQRDCEQHPESSFNYGNIRQVTPVQSEPQPKIKTK